MACQKSSPSPTSPSAASSATAASTTDARTGVTIIAARPAAPANAVSIPWAQQPITLTVSNGVTTGSAALTYTFEVGTEPTLPTVTITKSGIAAGNGTTSVALDKLSGSKTYYWRVRVDPPNGTGPYSTIRSFSVGPEVVLGTPVLASPINGAQTFTPVTLMVTNISKTGPAGPIVYTIDVSTTPGFENIIFNSDVVEQTNNGQTSVTLPLAGFNNGQTYYWRAKATDGVNKIVTPYSGATSFVVQTFSFASAKIWDSPPDLAVWPETTKITSIEFTGSAMRVDFDRREGPNAWPDQVPPGFQGPLEYTLGMCRNVGGWNCAGIVQFWSGRSLDDTAPPSRFWREWWYDGARWGPLATNPPQEGEIVGVFVGSGDLRGRTWTRDTCPGVCERSNVAFVPFTAGYAFYPF